MAHRELLPPMSPINKGISPHWCGRLPRVDYELKRNLLGLTKPFFTA